MIIRGQKQRFSAGINGYFRTKIKLLGEKMAKIVIIGGGVGGLSAGIYGALSGHEVTLIEKHSATGGNLTGWRREGYTIDNCIHWLTGTNPATETYKTWVELGALGDGVEIVKCNTLYTYSLGNREISLCRDLDRLENRMLEISPADSGEIKALMRAVRAIQGYSGIGGKNHDRGIGPGELVLAAPYLLRYYKSSCLEISRRFKSPLLSGFIRSFLGDCFAAIALVFVFAHFTAENGDLPRGGSIEMARRMTERLKGLGGNILLNTEVLKINHKCGKAYSVSLSDGQEIFADYFVFTCDPMPNYERLLSLSLPKGLAKNYERRDMLRFSSYHAAFCVDGEAPFKGDYVFPLSDKQSIKLMCDHLILREFSHEPDFSPQGKSIIQAMVFIGEPTCRALIRLRRSDPEEYKRRKASLAKETADAITGKFPELSGRIRLLDFWTPATYERFTGAEIGSYMSFALPKKYIPRRAPSEIPQIKNVFLATQWQMAPGGLPTAADLGKTAIKKIQAAEKSRARTRQGGTFTRPRPIKEG